MRFASQGAVAAAMASSLVSATPIDYQTPAAGVDVSASVNLGHGSNSANSGNQPAHGSGLDLSALVNLGHGSNSAGSGNQPTHGSGLDLSALVNITHGSNLASLGNQPAHGSGLDLSALVNLSHESVSASVSLNKDLSGKVLAAGILAHATVGDIADVKEDLEISVTCNDCYTRGNIDAKVSLEHTVPVLSLTITDIEAKLDLDIKATDATSIAVNLLAVSALEMPFLGLDLDATVYLDLVIGVSAEVDITAGIEIELVDEAVVTTDILSGDIITAAFAGLEVDVLPIAVRIGCSELHATLRLRVELNGAVNTAAGNALSIANIVPEIGAGLELGVFVNIAEYIGLFCPDALCPLPRESYGLNIGAIVDLDVNVEDLAAHIAIVPTVSTALLSAPEATHCHPALPIIIIGGQGPLGYVTGITAPGVAIGVPTGVAGGVPTGVPTGVAGGVPTGVPTGVAGGVPTGVPTGVAGGDASASASNGPSASGSASDNASASASDNASGSASASGSDNASASVTGTATGPVTGLPSASVTGGGSSESGFPTSDITIPAGYVVSTVTQTATYTMTTCAVNVANCPGPLQGETTLVHTTVYTTVCPATAVITDMHPAPTAAESSAAAAVPHVTAVPCSSVNTFNPDGQVAYPSSSFPTTTKHAEYPTYAARNYPVESVATTTAVVPTTKHAEYPTAPAQEYPVESVGTTTAATSTTKNVEYPTAPAQEYPVESVGTTTAGASTTEHAEYPTAPAEEYPVYPVESATTETYPVEHPTTKPAYPTAPHYPSMPVPSVHNGTATYPATHPAATTYPGVAHPTAATYPVAATYPAVTLSTYHVAPTGAYPTKPVYPTAPHSVETPVPVAGASKQVVGSGVIVAAAGVFMALF